MAKFLNTEGLNEWIPKIIEETEKELIIITPYIKTSERIFKYLNEANTQGKEIIIVYREEKMSESEKVKLTQLENLSLLHHPNIHAKCFFNENYLLICSMNLYEYSEINNREMGALYPRNNASALENRFDYSIEENNFSAALDEIRTIITSSQMEKKSLRLFENGFVFEILKTERERQLDYCIKLNKVFENKRFEPTLLDDSWQILCKNYFDKIDVIYSHRLEIELQMDTLKIEDIFNKSNPFYNEFKFKGFKFYWNHPKGKIYLYIDKKDLIWKDVTDDEVMKKERKVLDELISHLRNFM